MEIQKASDYIKGFLSIKVCVNIRWLSSDDKDWSSGAANATDIDANTGKIKETLFLTAKYFGFLSCKNKIA